jgi:hypothetical protein
MANPLNLMIKTDEWENPKLWGEVPPNPDSPHWQVLLYSKSPGAADSGRVFAACNGTLSVRAPAGARETPDSLTVPQAASNTSISAITLYLIRWPFFRDEAAFDLRLRQLTTAVDFYRSLTGFTYVNVDVASLKDYLKDQLTQAGLEEPFDLPFAIDQFLAGTLDIEVTAGQAIGLAAVKAGGVRCFGMNVLTSYGAIDPGRFYQHMADFVKEGQAAVDTFTSLVVPKWPALVGLDDQQAAKALTQSVLFPWSDLLAAKAHYPFTRADWRDIGDGQKALYLDRLRSRWGAATQVPNQEPFAFNITDWTNVFQLEAVTEFYLNMDDPWAASSQPREKPSSAMLGDTYRHIALFTPTGEAASIDSYNPAVIHLGTTLDLTKIPLVGNSQLYATLFLDEDQSFVLDDPSATGTKGRDFVITAAFNDALQETCVEVDSAPVLAKPQSAWHIALHSAYRTIDFLNPSGEAAVLHSPDPDTTVVDLDTVLDLDRFSLPFRDQLVAEAYDEIFLDCDQSSTGKKGCWYRVLSASTVVDPVLHTRLAIDRASSASDAGLTSAWEIRFRPAIVIVEPLGFRATLSGSNAIQTAVGSSSVVLDCGSSARDRITPYFDTIYFASDSGQHKPSHTYRITSLSTTPATLTVTVDGTPSLPLGGSLWHIPAGLSADSGPDCDIRCRNEITASDTANSGCDHYDGRLFVVYDGRIQCTDTCLDKVQCGRGQCLTRPLRCTSFRTRSVKSAQTPHGDGGMFTTTSQLPSIRGNQQYESRSYFPVSNEYQNYCFDLRSQGRAHGKVNNARCYFQSSTTATDHSQCGILLHSGLPFQNPAQSDWNWSLGCVVSDECFQLRCILIEAFQRMQNAVSGSRIPKIDRLRFLDQAASQAEYTSAGHQPTNAVTKTDWDFVIFATLYLIRPDEKPGV